jgi:hypothetical protein
MIHNDHNWLFIPVRWDLVEVPGWRSLGGRSRSRRIWGSGVGAWVLGNLNEYILIINIFIIIMYNMYHIHHQYTYIYICQISCGSYKIVMI